MRETKLKRLHAVWLSLYDILKKATLQECKVDRFLLENGGDRGVSAKEEHEEFGRDVIKLCYVLIMTAGIHTFMCDEILSTMHVCLVTQLYTPLWDPMDCSPPGSSVHGILQARIPAWVAISSSRGFFPSRDWTWMSCIAGPCIGRHIPYHWVPWMPSQGYMCKKKKKKKDSKYYYM